MLEVNSICQAPSGNHSCGKRFSFFPQLPLGWRLQFSLGEKEIVLSLPAYPLLPPVTKHIGDPWRRVKTALQTNHTDLFSRVVSIT